MQYDTHHQAIMPNCATQFQRRPGPFGYGFCQAGDAAGVTGSCSTQNTELLDVIENVADYSFVTFSWNSNGECRLIGISTQSFYIP